MIKLTHSHDIPCLAKSAAALRDAERDYREAVREAFPLGAVVQVGSRLSHCHTTVCDHSLFDDRVKVDNWATGKSYWVHAFRLYRVGVE